MDSRQSRQAHARGVRGGQLKAESRDAGTSAAVPAPSPSRCDFGVILREQRVDQPDAIGER